MELLITPAQVAQMAFRAPDFISPDAVGEATILAAQKKFVQPVLGDALFEALCRGVYPTLLADYIQPPLALYVKMLMLPSLAIQTGMAGVVEVNSKNLARVTDAKLRAVIRRLRGDALALMRRAVEHIHSSIESYPEYAPASNILNRCSTDGGIVLATRAYGKHP